MLCWNKALWLAHPSTMTISNQSECFISAWHTSYATLKTVYDISSRSSGLICIDIKEKECAINTQFWNTIDLERRRGLWPLIVYVIQSEEESEKKDRLALFIFVGRGDFVWNCSACVNERDNGRGLWPFNVPEFRILVNKKNFDLKRGIEESKEEKKIKLDSSNEMWVEFSTAFVQDIDKRIRIFRQH